MQHIPHGRYRHFKGQYYQVIRTVKHSETEEWMVVYYPEYAPQTWWVRPLSMFTEVIERDGVSQPRFRHCEED